LILDRERQRPFFPEHRELVPVLFGAAISLDPIWIMRALRSGTT
jgi:hypothetical protein